MRKRFLVTGGAGFIGSNFVRYTREAFPDAKIVVLDALTYAGSLASLDPVIDQIDFVEGSVTDMELVDRLVEACDVVVHFAAESHNDNSFLAPLKFVETNTMGTAVILEAVRKHGKRLHHISTDEVYGSLELDEPRKFTPETRYDPSSMYSASKASADLLVLAAVRQFGVEATISNCSNNYGPYQHVEKFIPRMITNILQDEKPKLYGDGLYVRDWIHVDDHNRAVHEIIEKGRIGETYLIGANGEEGNRVVLETVLDVMDKPRDWYETVPDRPAHDRRYAIDASKLRDELGWEPLYTNLREGLVQTVRWYRAHEDWWREAKNAAEKRYKKLGR